MIQMLLQWSEKQNRKVKNQFQRFYHKKESNQGILNKKTRLLPLIISIGYYEIFFFISQKQSSPTKDSQSWLTLLNTVLPELIFSLQKFITIIIKFIIPKSIHPSTIISQQQKIKFYTLPQSYQISAQYYINIIISQYYIAKGMILIIINLLFSTLLAVHITPEEANFTHFKLTFNITYDSPEEQLKRQRIFNNNVQKLRLLECQSCGITKFTASSEQEMNQIQTLRLPQNIQDLKSNQHKLKLSADNDTTITKEPPSDSLDWRSKGAVSPVKAQGTCGTCWSFTTVAMAESSLLLKGSAWTTKLYSTKLSEQYLLKCTSGSSCNGGYLENAIDKALQKGLPYQSQFPYQPFSEKNVGVCSTEDLIQISNKTRISKYYINDEEIIGMLQDGPLAIAISAVGWQNYRSGIFKCRANPKINHAVLLIGYTPTSWIIKNSWGTDFGEQGFVYVSRNKLQNCGVGVAVHSLFQFHISKALAFVLLILYFI